MTTSHQTHHLGGTRPADVTEQVHPANRLHPADGAAPDHRTDGTGGTDGTDASRQTGRTALLTPDEREEFTRRLHQAVNGFVDEPQRSVEEADALFEEVSGRIRTLLAEHHHRLRTPWHGEGVTAETEELRKALRRYRDAAEQLLRL
ncbi:MAG TPA: hypothetical protein VFY14_05465 [Streptomyces sp.]|nr:hypothetical protein [Streptomyces sp.]